VHGLHELLGHTSVLLAEKDAPLVERRLLVHLSLNLAVNVRSVFDFELDSASILTHAHNHVARLDFGSSELGGFTVNRHLPSFHLLFALLVVLEHF